MEEFLKFTFQIVVLSAIWISLLHSIALADSIGRISGHFDMENDQYITEGAEGLPSSDRWIRLRSSGYREGQWLSGEFSSEFGQLSNSKMSSYYILIPDLYVASSPQFGPAQVSLGRKKILWNRMDEEWQMGLWQPRFRWDYLRPELQGFTGAFVEWKEENLYIVGNVIGLYIPEEGRPIKERDGSLVSDGRWFSSPQSQMRLMDTSTRIRYNLDIPDLKEIILKDGYNLSARLGNLDKGFWIQGAYGYKPISQLLFRYNGFLRLENTDTIVDATVVPRVVYHRIQSAEAGYAGDRVAFWISGTRDAPEDNESLDGWTYQRINPILASSATLQFLFGLTSVNPTRLTFSYLRVDGGDSYDQGDLASGSSSIFGSRLEFGDAASMKIEGPVLHIKGHVLNAFLRWVYDFQQQGSMALTEFQYSVVENWNVKLGADLLGVVDENSGKKGFLYKYRANDRVYGGLTVVF